MHLPDGCGRRILIHAVIERIGEGSDAVFAAQCFKRCLIQWVFGSGLHAQSPCSSTDKNAFWGMLTEPTFFMRSCPLLLFQQLAFSRDVAAVALGSHIFPHGLDGFTGNDLSPNGRLQRDFKLVSIDLFLELAQDGPVRYSAPSRWQIKLRASTSSPFTKICTLDNLSIRYSTNS